MKNYINLGISFAFPVCYGRQHLTMVSCAICIFKFVLSWITKKFISFCLNPFVVSRICSHN